LFLLFFSFFTKENLVEPMRGGGGRGVIGGGRRGIGDQLRRPRRRF
jgi:hypothetical protein